MNFEQFSNFKVYIFCGLGQHINPYDSKTCRYNQLDMYGNNTYSLGLPHYNIYTNKLYSCANLANPDFLFTITAYSYAKLKFICEVKGFDPDAYKIEANLGLVVVIGISCGIPILIWTFLTSYKCVFGKRFRLYKTQIELEDELRPKPVRLTKEQI